MLRVACPKCKKPLGLPDNVAGKSVKCPQCQQVFKAPAQPAAKPAMPGSASTHPDDQEATPYGLREDAPTPEQLRKSAQGEAVDQMVVDARRVKLRNKAWEKVGTPAKFAKRAALTACIIWLITYLFMTMVIVLANHNMEAAEKTGGQINTGGVKALPKYLFIQDVIPGLTPQNPATRPLFLWLYCTAALLIALCIYGLQLAGAEQMKKLTNYRLSLFAMIVGTLTLNLFGIMGLLALMDKQVQYEFRVTARRQAGIEGEAIYVEDDGEDEENDDEDEEEEDEEEEEEVPRARKR